MEGQMSLFSDERADTPVDASAEGLRVVKMSFIQGEVTSWEDLFSGYQTLRAITYSSGIGFISRLIKKFEDAEIIFGCEQVMSYSLNEIMAFQTKVLERIQTGKNQQALIDRISDGTLRMRVTRTKLSHEKIYLLSSEDGRKRVIMGSANMSYQAFSGIQRENIAYLDGDEAYDWYYDIYCSLRDDCTDEITAKALGVSIEKTAVDELPISQTVKVKKALEIVPDKTDAAEVEFALDVSKLSGDYKSYKPKADKSGKIVLTPSKLVTMRTHIAEFREQERAKRKEFPQLVIDVEQGSVSLNEKKWDLHPHEDEVRNDVELFLQYMEGYSAFHGDFEHMQRRYYEFANWFFCSPFMAVMRDTAARYNQNLLPYPIFGLIYGQSKAGKTTFLETLLKMMIGQKTRLAAPDFTRSSIDAMRYQVKGAPIIVDDLTQTRFSQHAVETIKNDSFGAADKLIHYPAVVISANDDVKAVSQEIIRRTVICHVQAGLTNTEVMKSNIVRKVQKGIGTAFYREYLRRMLEQIPDLLNTMKDDDMESAPDIMKISSVILLEIIAQFTSEEVPAYVRELSLQDYFSEQVTGNHAIRTIQTAWRVNRKCFSIDKRANKLTYDAGQSYEADRIVKELPETLVPRKSRNLVIMNLDEACEFFGVQFRKSAFDFFRG